ncbi:myosin-binding protein 3 isoform X2 [Ricinus communis]|uniref:myosin-binding protein 3 isoform X2 n=1 Tax=Ricinus communis TaxID=3988 RepID=UPI0007726459|nr:myosin-binding protein 3 isoform X2 [Ricinus communis]|eukprot:XP_015582099.1 myosin-binding protein 3 isoform X2 [Ricinus communis]
MAGNKFATMLQRNTHKLTVILVYAVLEWILIILLLLNSFFAYLITKFANYFGLKPPCLWCSRVDHVLEPGNSNTNNSYRDLVCETHATEISKLGYCSNHRRLAETQNMCNDCLASRPNDHNDYESVGMTRRIAFISWVSCRDTLENGDKMVKCSCCKESLDSNLYPPCLLFKPSWKTLKYTQKGNLIIEAIDDDNNGSDQCKLLDKADNLEYYNADGSENGKNDGEELHMLSDIGSFGLKDSIEEECSGSESNLQGDEKEGNVDQKADRPSITEQDCYGLNLVHRSFDEDIIQHYLAEDNSLKIINLQFPRDLECEFNRLIPVELIDSSTFANHGPSICQEEDLGKLDDHQDEASDISLQIETQGNVFENEENTSYVEVENIQINVDDGAKSSVLNLKEMGKDLVSHACEISLQTAQPLSTAVDNVELADKNGTDGVEALEEENNDFKLLVDPSNSKATIELSNHATNQPQEQDSPPAVQSLRENNSTTNGNDAENPSAPDTYLVHDELGPNYKERTFMEAKMFSADKNQEAINQQSSAHSESNEVEEEKFPETPTSVDCFNYLHKKLFEKREPGTEESLDGSVVSETDGGDPLLSVEKLKTALKAERKALNALYSELEEERSASAIAANQTMAMINRLQEEKAAMQMEALQYQRMMEEQSEYDQEALQLLNELMLKREREKQELEKELEVYRKKVLNYEAKEKIIMLRKSKDGSVRSRNSSATCSNSEDIDELSIDLNREARDEDGSIYGNQDSININTPGDEAINLEEIALDCVKQISSLDDSLAEFEEERLSILDQLKALEERLIALNDKELINDRNSVGSSSKYSERGFDESYELSTPEENGISHGLSKGKHCTERKTMGSMAKSLLPLLDAADNETEEGLIFEENAASEFVEMENSSVSNFELDSKKLALEEEVDHVYERLQALEADREFLKHCMSSINKGDKGMDLLQEILQHLRDLRAVELRVRNLNDDPLG